MADSYDDFLSEQTAAPDDDSGGGGVATPVAAAVDPALTASQGDDDSYEEYKRQQRQAKLAADRAAARHPAPQQPAPTTPSGALNLTPYAGPPTATAPAQGANPLLRQLPQPLAPNDVTGQARAMSGQDASAGSFAEQLHESPTTGWDALASPGGALAGVAKRMVGLAGTAVDTGAQFLGEQAQAVEDNPVGAAEGMAKAAVTAVPRIAAGVGGVGARALSSIPGNPLGSALSYVTGLPKRDEDAAPTYAESLGKIGGGVLDALALTDPLVEGAGDVAAGLREGYTTAKGASALDQAAADMAAARKARMAARADASTGAPEPGSDAAQPPAGPLALPPGQYEMPGETVEGNLAALDQTKVDAAAAARVRAQGQALQEPRALLAPSSEEAAGAAQAKDFVGSPLDANASPDEVAAYRTMRDAGVGVPGRELGSPKQLPGESPSAYADRVINRQGIADANMERSAIQDEGMSAAERETAARAQGQFSSITTKGGALRSVDQFPKLTDDALLSHMADLLDNKLGAFKGAQQKNYAARLDAAESELESRGMSNEDIWSKGLDRGRDLNLDASARSRAGGTEAGPLAMIVGTGAGAAVGAAAAPPGQRAQGAATGAIAALGLVAVGASLARDGMEVADAVRPGEKPIGPGNWPVRPEGGMSDEEAEWRGRTGTPVSEAERVQEVAAREQAARQAPIDAAAAAATPERRAAQALTQRAIAGAQVPVDPFIQEMQTPLSDAERVRVFGRRRTGALGDVAQLEPKEDTGAGASFPERLYSRSQRAIEQAPFKKGTAEQWSAQLAKNVGQDERAALQPYLDENKGKVLSKSEVLTAHANTKISLGEKRYETPTGPRSTDLTDIASQMGYKVNPGDRAAFNALPMEEKQKIGAESSRRNLANEQDKTSAGRPMYESYTEPGGTNYREHVLTLEKPGAAEPEEAAAYNRRVQVRAQDMADSSGDSWEQLGPNGRQRYLEAANRDLSRPADDAFRSSHWPTDNPLVHVRMSDRELPSGEKALHVEEIQSDWHQKGRREGYRGPSTAEDMGDLEQERAGPGVPDAPFKKTTDWAELGLKKAIDEAVHGDYDRVTFASGADQAARYDLSRQVDELRYKNNNQLTALKDGRVVHSGHYDPKALASVVGKDVAEKLIATEPIDHSAALGPAIEKQVAADADWDAARGRELREGTTATREYVAYSAAIAARDAVRTLSDEHGAHVLKGQDLAVGGRGMHEFYDKMLPNVIKDYGKKLGVPLETERVPLRSGEQKAWQVNEPNDADVDKGPANHLAVDAALDAAHKNVEPRLIQDALERMNDKMENGSTFHDALMGLGNRSREALIDHLHLTSSAADAETKAGNLSFKVTPELRAKVLKEGQRIGAASPRVVKTLAGAAAGGVAGSFVGDTPEQRKRNAILGLAGGALAGAALGREAKALSAGEKAELGAAASMEREPITPKATADAIVSTFAPHTRGDMAAATGEIIRARRGQIDREVDVAQHALDRVKGDTDTLPLGKKLSLVDDIEHGRPQSNPSHQPLANALRRTLDGERDAIQDSTGKLEHFIANYMPHLWQDPDAATNWLSKIMGKRPLEGSKSFLKQRTIPTVLEGMFPEGAPKHLDTMSNAEILAENKRQGGLVPVTFNPVEATMLKLREMKKYRMAQQVLGDLTDRGLLAPIKEGARMPAGYARIGDWAFAGKAAPEPVARVLNNYLSPGLRGHALFDAYMAVGNTLNQSQLGLSAFHAGMDGLNTIVSQNALALEKLFGGKAGEAVKLFATSPGAVVSTMRKGSELLKAYSAAPGTLSGPIKAIADGIAEAGGRPRMSGFDDASKAFANALEAKQYGRVGKKLIPALVEKTTGVVMNQIVPRMKLGVFYDLAADALGKLGPEANPDDVRRAMQKAWDSVDNRMGSVVYDNLFINKTMKDVMHATVRSVGWNWGTLRELGGGVKDLTGFAKDVVTGKGGELSHRAAYTMALPMTIGLAGAVMQYLYTGKGPSNLFDMFHPKTGSKDADGNDNRVMLPSYMKDVYNVPSHPIKSITSKMNPLLSTLADMLSNKNFYGDQIYNEDDPFMKELAQSAKFAAKETTPFMIQNVIEGKQRQEKPSEMAAAFVGVTPASREAVRTKAQNAMADLAARKHITQTPEEQDASRIRSTLRDKVKTEGPAAAMAELHAHLRDGTLTTKQIQNILKDDQTPYLVKQFKSLPLADAERIYKLGTAREQALWGPVLEGKRQRAQ